MAQISKLPKQTFAFLQGVGEHNEKAWFEANRPLYEAGYVGAGRDIVETLGPRLKQISPGVRYEPKIGGSIIRVNRDIRFSKDKRPYKDHLDLWFWHGEQKGWDQPGFYLRIMADKVYLGVGMHEMMKDNLERFRIALGSPKAAKSLLKAVEQVGGAGYTVGGKSRKIPPRGVEARPEVADYLLYEALYADATITPSAAGKAGFVDAAEKHFRATWPIGKWLLDEVCA